MFHPILAGEAGERSWRSSRNAVLGFLCVLAGVLPGADATALAATFMIRPDGTGTYPTVQAALDVAANGDEIVLASGVFIGVGNADLNPNGKAVVIRSETGNPADCVIDCSQGANGRGLYFAHGETRDTRVEGIRFTRGHAWDSEGGGVLCRQPE